jgi:hypothetical protein
LGHIVGWLTYLFYFLPLFRVEQLIHPVLFLKKFQKNSSDQQLKWELRAQKEAGLLYLELWFISNAQCFSFSVSLAQLCHFNSIFRKRFPLSSAFWPDQLPETLQPHALH